MPELPEVETIRRALEPWLVGRTIRSAARAQAPRGPKYARLERAAGQRILTVGRRGKFLLLGLSDGDELIVHLGMSGRLGAVRPAAHLRVVVELDGPRPRQLYFQDARRFGRFLLVRAGDYRALPALARMGPEPWDEDFSVERFFQALQRSRTAVKTYLLSQRPVAGVGNIYADEALWRARIHPRRASSALSKGQARALYQSIRGVLEAALAAQGTTLRDYRTVLGERGSFQLELAVYGRSGESCPRCGRSIERLVLGGRSSCFCPRCQKPA